MRDGSWSTPDRGGVPDRALPHGRCSDLAGSDPRTIYLIRHPESDGNREGRLQGHLDSPLSELGMLQGQRLRERFAPVEFSALYASSLARCRLVADLLAQDKGIAPRYLEGLKERSYGAWAQLTLAEANRRFPAERERVRTDPYAAPPGGESAVEVWDRVQDSWGEILRAGHDRLVVVSHAGTLVTLLGSLIGLPRETPWGAYPFRLANAGVSMVEIGGWGTRAAIHLLNDTCHLEGLPLGAG